MKKIYMLIIFLSATITINAQSFIRFDLPTPLSIPSEITYSPDNFLWAGNAGGRSTEPDVTNPGISGPAEICPGQTGTVYSVSPVAGTITYNWTVPAGTTITGGSGTNSITVSWPNPYTLNANICVTASAILGGVGAPRCKSVIASMPIPSQPGSISGQSGYVCGQTIVYSVNNAPGTTSYTWTMPSGGTINSGQGSNSINVTWGILITGQVSVTADNACGSSPASTQNIAGTPPIPGTISPLPSVICNGGPANFSIAAVAGVTGYIWTVPANGSTIDNGQGTTAIDVTWGTGNGAVTVRSQNACGLSGSQIVNVVPICRLANNDVKNKNNFTLFPNPANERTTITFQATAGVCEINIMNLSGRRISTMNINAKEDISNIEVDLGGIAKGVYVVELRTATIIEKSKLIIE